MSTDTITEVAPVRLDEISKSLQAVLVEASEHSTHALEAGNRAGGLLHEAQSICERDGRSYRAWLDQQRLSRDKARVLVQLHIDWGSIKDRIAGQTLLPFTEAKRLTDDRKPQRDTIAGAVWDDSAPIPDEAYEVPEALREDFEYPDEDPQEGGHAPADALAGVLRYVIPRKLQTREDWRTCMVRFVGTAFLIGAMPDNVSMRDACAALGVSHATISKYVRQLSDATGIRSPIMKREGAREVYRKVQTEGHWRRRGDVNGSSLG